MIDVRRSPTLPRWPLASRLLGSALTLLLISCSTDRTTPPAGSGGGGRGAGTGAPVAVMTATVVEKPMPVNIRAIGNVEPSSTVEVRSQVTGELRSVHFTEGREVNAGDLLFTIDARGVEATIKQVEATLARDAAQSAAAESQRVRLASLLKDGLIPQAEYDAQAAVASALQASMAAGRAQIESAKLQLQYTRIAAPVAGRTGALLVHVGAIVRAADATPLVVINRMAPVFVSFAVPARLLPRLRNDRGRPFGVVAAPSGTASGVTSNGTVSFIDNAVDQATDTIRLKASFPNTDRKLWPGAFVDVTLQLAVEPRALVVPAAAVQPGQQGQYVYVVKDDQTVEARPVTVAWIEGDDTVIQTGLRAGETVVTDGQLRLTPGARVTVKGTS